MSLNTIIVGGSGIFVNHFEGKTNIRYNPVIISTNQGISEFSNLIINILLNERIDYIFYNSTIPSYNLLDYQSASLIDKSITYFSILLGLVKIYSPSTRVILLSTAAFNLNNQVVNSAYLSAKRAAEYILKNSEIENYSILKLFNVYGKGGNLVVDSLKRKFIKAKNPVQIKGGEVAYRNFTFIGDLIDFLIEYKFRSSINETIYVCGPDECTIGELAKLLSKIYSKDFCFEDVKNTKLSFLAPTFDDPNAKYVKVGKPGRLTTYLMDNND